MRKHKNLVTGIALIVIGLAVTTAGSIVVHMTEAPPFDSLGRELFPNVPRGWILTTVAQLVALGGVLVAMAGVTVAWVYKRTLTWATAMLGALLFTALMFIIFAIIPNQFLTLTQATLEWTPRKIFVTIPLVLALNNEVSISYAVLKDMIAAGYASTMLILVPVVMYKWQERPKKVVAPKPAPVSHYGRPLRVDP
ncbi:MAG: hypothetical protein QGD89_02420 [Actinomycetota bacterium]|nr:hypothetical protein [Actinomycetota bacterium]